MGDCGRPPNGNGAVLAVKKDQMQLRLKHLYDRGAEYERAKAETAEMRCLLENMRKNLEETQDLRMQSFIRVTRDLDTMLVEYESCKGKTDRLRFETEDIRAAVSEKKAHEQKLAGNIQQLECAKESSQTARNEMRSRWHNEQETLKSLEAQRAELRNEILSKEEELHKTERLAADLTVELQSETSRLNDLQRDANDLEQDLCQAKSENAKKIAELAAFNAQAAGRLDKAEQCVASVSKELADVNDALDESEKRHCELDDLRKQLEAASCNERQRAQESLRKLQEERCLLVGELSASTKLLTKAELESRRLTDDACKANNMIGDLTIEVERLEQRLKDGRIKLAVEKRKYDSESLLLAGKLSAADRKLSVTKCELNDLRRLSDQYEITIKKLNRKLHDHAKAADECLNV